MGSAYEDITNQIIKMMEGGTIPWRKPWNGAGLLPTSLSTGKPYRGINTMILGITASVRGYDSPYWGTYRQMQARGAQVNKGEKSTMVTLWKPFTKREKDESGQEQESMGFMLRTYNVFSADQCDWGDGIKPTLEMVEHDPISEADAIIANYFAPGDAPGLGHGEPRAYYSPLEDRIMMPPKGVFDLAEGYYSTLFHEMTHSTGHKTRLDRDGVTEGHRFGDPDYSKEELVAELGAAFLCSEVGIAPDGNLENSAAYIQNWLKALQNDPRMIIQASGKAQKAADFIMGRAREDEKKDEAAA